MSTLRPPKVSKRQGITLVEFGSEYSELDEVALESVRDVMLQVADSADPPRVLVDLSHTSFFGSSFIEVLFRLWNRLEQQPGGVLAISGLHPYCEEVISLTHLDRLWKLYPNVDAAVTDMTA